RRALPVADVGDIGTGLVVVDEELGSDVGSGKHVELGQRLPDAARTARPLEPARERLPRLALVVELLHDAYDGFGRVLRRDLRGLRAELHLRLAEMTAEQHLITGRGASVRAAFEPEEPDVAHVVLTAAVRAARDVDAYAADFGESRVFERVAD